MSKDKNKELFRNVIKGYLTLKDIYNDTDIILDSIFEYNTFDMSREVHSNYINLLFYKDIVYGIWNKTTSISQATFQILYSVDLELALHSILISPSEKENIENTFKKLIRKMESLKTTDDFFDVIHSISEDTTWIPIVKEYRKLYVFLLINMLTLTYFNCSFDDVSDLDFIMEVVGEQKCLS